MIQYEPTFINRERLPRVWQVTRGGDAPIEMVLAWLEEERANLEREVHRYAAVLVRGVKAVDSAQNFESFMGAIAPQLMDYIGGTSPRKKVHGKIMTATELPCDFSIPLHQEMSYTDDAPDRIVFDCLSPASEGGCTTIGDMRRITERIDAQVRLRFAAKNGVQLRRTLPCAASLHKKPGVAKVWSEVFDTHDAEEASRVAARRGWRLAWLDDGSAQLWQEVRPATKVHAVTGDEVWHNQVHIFAPAAAIAWARKDGRHEAADQIETALRTHPQMVDRVLHGNGEMVADEDVMHVFDVMDQAATPLHWQRHDVLILDNVLAAHGRTSFRGPRNVLAALVRDRPALAQQAA
jgi:alpha-ketoglutarate-dependent taurine dioxygenase